MEVSILIHKIGDLIIDRNHSRENWFISTPRVYSAMCVMLQTKGNSLL